jgi:hypothetical protein
MQLAPVKSAQQTLHREVADLYCYFRKSASAAIPENSV